MLESYNLTKTCLGTTLSQIESNFITELFYKSIKLAVSIRLKIKAWHCQFFLKKSIKFGLDFKQEKIENNSFLNKSVFLKKVFKKFLKQRNDLSYLGHLEVFLISVNGKFGNDPYQF